MMRYGSQYFRPPHPAKENWQKDMQNMHTLGFNTVKLWAVWNTIERTEGSFDFSDLDELVRIAGSSGLRVIINIIPEARRIGWKREMKTRCIRHRPEAPSASPARRICRQPAGRGCVWTSRRFSITSSGLSAR